MASESPSPERSPTKSRARLSFLPRKGSFFTPAYFLIRAVVLVLLFLLFHVLGWREHTGFFSGTMTGGQAGAFWAAAQGTAYALAYFLVVLGVPILILAAGIQSILLRFGKR